MPEPWLCDVTAGDLQQAELGPVGVLADKLGVDSDEAVVLQRIAEVGQPFCVCY